MLHGLLSCLDGYSYLAQSHQWWMKGIGLKEEIDLSGHTVEKNALEGMGSDSRRLVYFDNSRKK